MTASQRFSIRAPLFMGLAAVVALVLVFGLWGTMTRISGAIIAQGHVEVERDRQIVQHRYQFVPVQAALHALTQGFALWLMALGQLQFIEQAHQAVADMRGDSAVARFRNSRQGVSRIAVTLGGCNDCRRRCYAGHFDHCRLRF